MNIILTGFMASGKTVVGKELAKKLKMDFIDTDELIEKRTQKSVSEIFKDFGEAYFRHLENETAKELVLTDDTVIATGGGFVLNTENTALLSKNGIIINLEPTQEVILTRLLKSTQRPLADGVSESELLKRFSGRKPYYDCCDIKIQVTLDKSIQNTADEIITAAKERKYIK